MTEHGERALTPALSQRARVERHGVRLGAVCWVRAGAMMDMPQAYGLPTRTLTDALSSEERDRVRCSVDWHRKQAASPVPVHPFATRVMW